MDKDEEEYLEKNEWFFSIIKDEATRFEFIQDYKKHGTNYLANKHKANRSKIYRIAKHLGLKHDRKAWSRRCDVKLTKKKPRG